VLAGTHARREEGSAIGYLTALYQLDDDPADAIPAYTPYTFVPLGHTGPLNMSMDRSFGRRESVMVVPSMDSVLDAFGRLPGPMDRRDQRFGFRRLTGGNNDAEYDRLMAWCAPGNEIRLVYLTDGGILWYTTASNPRVTVTETSGGNWGLDGFIDFEITWRIRPDWRLRTSELSSGFHRGSTFVHGSTFGSLGVVVISANTTNFTIDATGTAGANLPTIDDTAPTITITGPAGGDGGILLANTSAAVRDSTGAKQATQVLIPFKLATASDSVVLKLASQTFLHNGVAFRPIKPAYQPWYFKVVAGLVNACSITAQGANSATSGTAKVDWWRRRA